MTGGSARFLNRPRCSDCQRQMTPLRRRLLMVFTIVLVAFATLATVQYRRAVVRTEESVLKTNLFRMRDAIDQYHRNTQQWPPSLEHLVQGGYMRSVPKDPITRGATWRSVPARDGGIVDVKSTAKGKALDGSRYADW